MWNPLNRMLFRQPHVCRWWCCFTFDNPIRKLFHDPQAILSPYVREGFTVIDIGPGMGYFTTELARLVGPTGKVIAIDLQEKMLAGVRRRVERAGLADRLETRLTGQQSLDVETKADFILAFWMVHEVPDRRRFLKEVAALLGRGGSFLIVEPYLHVSRKVFSQTIRTAEEVGLIPTEEPKICFSRATVLTSSSAPSHRL